MPARSPIVAILGHVDHGKTSLLDFIRKSRLTVKEHGGITQRIGAYSVETGIKGYPTSKVTFIDTPGHEAFTKLRSRGATTADVAILIIDAKDSVMPQTIESIAHIKASKIPFIVALNKTDLPESNPQKVERDLLRFGIQTEHQGGRVPAIKISAKTGTGVKDLLEAILLVASDRKLSYDEKAPAKCVIIETSKDRRGIIASVILQDGVLKTGQTLYTEKGELVKVRAMIDDLGKQQKEITPSSPVQILGFQELPEVGTTLSTEKPEAKEVTEKHNKPENKKGPMTQAEMLKAMLAPKVEEKKLAIIAKTDSQGSLEALVETLSDNKKIDLILAAVGDIHRSDIFLAKTTGAIIVGFSVNVDPETAQLAQQEKIVIKTYSIIYEILEELEEVTNLIAAKEAAAKNLKAEGKVLASFDIEGEKAYGMSITKGKFALGDEIQAFREGNNYGKAKIISLKFKAKNISEAKKGEECGFMISPDLDMRVGDIVKCIL
ncbi:MAG: GTP-binding protein [Patescibacteria group bacterium]